MSSLFSFDSNMSTSGIYSIKLPYLGAILLGKSPLNLTSFQKHLRELYIEFNEKSVRDERRIVISNTDISIFEPGKAEQAKRTFIYANFESIVDVQILKFSFRRQNPNETNQQIQAAFFPIGCENEQRFRSLYSNIPQTQLNLLSSINLSHPPLVIFVIRKPGLGDSSSLLDCHVFAVQRELHAFELCNTIRKLIVKQTMSPIIIKRRTLICKHDQSKDINNNDLLSNVKINDVDHSFLNPVSSSLMVITPVQQSQHNSSSSSNETSKVLTINRDMSRMSSPIKQRCFIKASKLIENESDEIVNDLMNLVATEKLKTQYSFKRHASSEQLSLYTDESFMNKKRYFHNKKRLSNSSPTRNEQFNQRKIPSRIQSQLIRPTEIIVNRCGDIGNYVPKFLRENITTRSSDSNENIFFRSNKGQLINGFLQLDILSNKTTQDNHSQSTPCLNQIHPLHRISDMEINDDHRVPHISKSFIDIVHPQLTSPITPKRVASFTVADNQPSVNYRQYLRHTDQGAYLYGEGKRQQTTLEHSLGYFP